MHSNLNFDLKPEWIMVSPGMLNLNNTDICIAFHPSFGLYYIFWKNRIVTSKGIFESLEIAKEAALSYINELLIMGYDP